MDLETNSESKFENARLLGKISRPIDSTEGFRDNSQLQWFPDGRHLAFSDFIPRKLQLVVVDESGSFHEASPKSCALRLIEKVNEVVSKDRLGNPRDPKSKYPLFFDLTIPAKDGRVLWATDRGGRDFVISL
mmetsp:Transcript_7609/g.14073  ORF Transcript_7609/g.14073 Transcript_7609/m.14073 type:complete len:132 (+) Transcript_7609:545-940(+)